MPHLSDALEIIVESTTCVFAFLIVGGRVAADVKFFDSQKVPVSSASASEKSVDPAPQNLPFV